MRERDIQARLKKRRTLMIKLWYPPLSCSEKKKKQNERNRDEYIQGRHAVTAAALVAGKVQMRRAKKGGGG
jgi:hypothetical protein